MGLFLAPAPFHSSSRFAHRLAHCFQQVITVLHIAFSPQVKPLHRFMCDAGISGGGFVYIPAPQKSQQLPQPPSTPVYPPPQPTAAPATPVYVPHQTGAFPSQSPSTPVCPHSQPTAAPATPVRAPPPPTASSSSSSPSSSHAPAEPSGYRLVPRSQTISNCSIEAMVPW